MNYDPGGELKYVGSLMIVVGILLVYLLRVMTRLAAAGTAVPGQTRADVPSVAKQPIADVPSAVKRLNGGSAILLFLILAFSGGICRGEDRQELDWTAWRKTPVFVEGRLAPLDTFARETVEAICGRVEPTIKLKDGATRAFSASELLFAWLSEPERWENESFLIAEDRAVARRNPCAPALR